MEQEETELPSRPKRKPEEETKVVEKRMKWGERWNAHFSQLCTYKKVHGHAKVPRTSKEYAKLSMWVDKQRQAKRRGTLNTERVAKLDSIGFVWGKSSLRPSWNDHLKDLREYRALHGHVRIPRRYAPNQSLAGWVQYQREAYHAGKLDEEKIKLLNEEGFLWRVYSWKTYYQQIKTILSQGGVPDASLQKWIDEQKEAQRKGELSKKYEILLADIGIMQKRVIVEELLAEKP